MPNSIPVIRHIPHEPAGTMEDALRLAGLDFHYVDMFAAPPKYLDAKNVPALIIMGGPMNVDETQKYPYLADEIVWIREALAAETPIVGVCLGAQMLAKAGGVKVYPNGIKEIGWYPIELLPEAATDPLFHDLPTNLTVFQWHGDTFDLPAGAAYLAKSPLCKHQAFRLGKNAWGLQFHIEMTDWMSENWLIEPGFAKEVSELDYIDPEEIRRRTPEEMPGLKKLSATILGRFTELVKARL